MGFFYIMENPNLFVSTLGIPFAKNKNRTQLINRFACINEFHTYWITLSFFSNLSGPHCKHISINCCNNELIFLSKFFSGLFQTWINSIWSSVPSMQIQLRFMAHRKPLLVYSWGIHFYSFPFLVFLTRDICMYFTLS